MLSFALVNGQGLGAVGPEPHLRHRLTAQIANELFFSSIDIWLLELEDDLEGVCLTARIREYQ